MRLIGSDGRDAACPLLPRILGLRKRLYGHLLARLEGNEEPSVLAGFHLVDTGYQGLPPVRLQERMYDVQLRLVHIPDALAHHASHHGARVHGVGRFGHECHPGAFLVQFTESLGGALVHQLSLLGTGKGVRIHGVVHAHYLQSVYGHSVFGMFRVFFVIKGQR